MPNLTPSTSTVRDDLSLIAVQGPNAQAKAATLFTEEQRKAVEGMKPFFGVQAGDLFIATTGYTGEAGYEIALPMKKRPISGARWWKLALSHVAWARVTRCVWKRA